MIKKCIKCGKDLSINASYYSKLKYCRKCWLETCNDRRLYWQDYDWLYKHYIVKGMSMPQIADKVDTYQSRIGWWLHKLNIQTRSNGGTKSRRYVDEHKYVNIWSPNHPLASKSRPYKREHVLVMEKELGRYLSKTEVVHHLDGVRTNNDISNLKYFPNCSSHKLYEGKIQQFAKQLIWGDLNPSLKKELQDLFIHFLSRND